MVNEERRLEVTPPEPAVAASAAPLVEPAPSPSVAVVRSGVEAPRTTISAVLSARAASFQQCVDSSLLRGGIGGQLALGWVIVAGVVGSVHVVVDTTGNPLVGPCFSSVVAELQFSPALTAQVAAFPWSFTTE